MDQGTLQVKFSDDTLEVERQLSEIRTKFEGRPDEVIPMLQKVQRALHYLPEEVLKEIARLTRMPAVTVFGVASFYEQFRLHPVGKHIIKVCRGTACHVKGAERILEEIKTRFQLTPGETSEDRQFTLETVACFGSCALAPVMLVDDSVKGRMDPHKTRKILEETQVAAKELEGTSQ